MQILLRAHKNKCTILLGGSLNRESIPQLDFFLNHMLNHDHDRILLNMYAVSELDWDSLGHLVHRIAEIRRSGKHIALTIQTRNPKDLLSDISVSELIQEHPSWLSSMVDFPLAEIVGHG
jgi:ABC-type transporter Mla MlaB component